ncbi:NnrU family protein [Fodinicurvata sp. EGI_FJ10296]|uniref:NnrU family protein n=1 Tax=Fodinicurvata sp. EGI_FJ10296 TaxID=3231908 RepID=UPI00345572C1
MAILILGLIIFLGVHSVRIVAPDFRDRQIAARGPGAWRGIFSLVSLIGFVLIVWGYWLVWPTAPILYEPPVWMKHLNIVLMPFALIFVVASQLPAGRIKATLKHPMLVGVKIWALGHLLANGDLAALLLFGSFLAWAVADRIAARKRGDSGPAPGPVKWDGFAVAIGLGLYLLFVWRLHLWLFGVPAIAA